MQRSIRWWAAVLLLTVPSAASPGGNGDEAWTGSTEQKVGGLAAIWAEAKYGFPSFAAVPELDWDQSFHEFLPRVIEAETIEDYYRELMEFAGLLRDGHTDVLPPWGYFRPEFDHPPLEVRVVEGRCLVARVGDAAELGEAGLVPGVEIVSVDGVAARVRLDQSIHPYHPRGSTDANDAMNVFYLLRGPRGSEARLTVRGLDGEERSIALTRDSTTGDGSPFLPRFLEAMAGAPAIEQEILPDDLMYVWLANFDEPAVADAFLRFVAEAVEYDLPGLIIDLRQSLGGRSDVAEKMIGALIDASVRTPRRKYPHHVPAHLQWGRPRAWSTDGATIEPRDGPRYLGPIVVLTSPITGSTAEDFVISLRDGGRVTVVGERSAGSAGNPNSSPLPGGGRFRMATFRAYLPDGGEYVGRGIEPDELVPPTSASVRDITDPAGARAREILIGED